MTVTNACCLYCNFLKLNLLYRSTGLVTTMPADKQMKSLLQASEVAYQNTFKHILLSVSGDGRILASGTDKLESRFLQHPGILDGRKI